MGKIIKFPIIVIQDKATEEQFGITPQLRDSVRPEPTASREAVVSEAGIKSAIESGLDIYTYAANLSADFALPVFDSVGIIPGVPISLSPVSGSLSGAGNLVKYNSILGEGLISIASDDEHVYINGEAPEEQGDIIFARTLNGGILQEATKINYSTFDSNNIIGFHDPKVGDAIGKILIKCTEQFNDQTTQFSIGTKDDPEFFVKKFNVPQISGSI